MHINDFFGSHMNLSEYTNFIKKTNNSLITYHPYAKHRWFSWLKSVDHISRNFDLIVHFFKNSEYVNELEYKPISLKNIINTLNNENLIITIDILLAFLSDYYKQFVNINNLLESNNDSQILFVYHYFKKLEQYLNYICTTDDGSCFNDLIWKKLVKYNMTNDIHVLIDLIRPCIQSALDKLMEYLCLDSFKILSYFLILHPYYKKVYADYLNGCIFGITTLFNNITRKIYEKNIYQELNSLLNAELGSDIIFESAEELVGFWKNLKNSFHITNEVIDAVAFIPIDK